MELSDFHYLLSPEGQELLSELKRVPISPDNHLKAASRLRELVGPEQTQALLETALLRQRGVSKFRRAAQMYFTREGLEQSSSEILSRYRARRFGDAGLKYVADLGCGIGGDSIGIAEYSDVIGVDWDPLRLAMAQENLRVYTSADHFSPLQADLSELKPLPVDGLFADPGRRDDRGRRISSVYQYRPPLDYLDGWREPVPHQCIKISPGVNYLELPRDAEIEFVSLKGEVKEGILWFGDLKHGNFRRATLLPGNDTITSEDNEPLGTAEISAYLLEPDGAVIRAHLVEQLGNLVKASKIDPEIAYLSSDAPVSTPFARCFSIEEVMPFNLKNLRAYLRSNRIGRVDIKKRGSAVDLDLLQRNLRLRGDQHRILFLTRRMNNPVVIIAEEIKQAGKINP